MRQSQFYSLVLIAAVGPFSLNMIFAIPAAIENAFSTSRLQIQIVIALTFIAIGFIQFFSARLLVKFGPRQVMLISGLLLTASLLISAAAPSLEVFLFGRIIQVLSAGCGIIIARSIMYGEASQLEGAKLLSYLSVATTIAVIIAPFIGSLTSTHLSWRVLYCIIGAISGIAHLSAILGTRSWPLKNCQNEKKNLVRYGLPIWIRSLISTLSIAFASAVFLSFVTVGLDVIARTGEILHSQLGIYILITSLSYAAGGFVVSKLVANVQSLIISAIGGLINLSSVLAVLCFASMLSVKDALVVFVILSFGNGIIINALTIDIFAALSKTPFLASGLVGFFQTAIGGLIAFSAVLFSPSSLWSLAAWILSCVIASIAFLFLACCFHMIRRYSD